jgi:hypothetical protein
VNRARYPARRAYVPIPVDVYLTRTATDLWLLRIGHGDAPLGYSVSGADHKARRAVVVSRVPQMSPAPGIRNAGLSWAPRIGVYLGTVILAGHGLAPVRVPYPPQELRDDPTARGA